MSFLPRPLQSASGFTLSELLTASFVGLLVVGIAGLVINMALDQYMDVRSRLDAEIAAARAEYVFRTFFGQAVDVRFTNPTPPGPGNAAGVIVGTVGEIRNNINFNQNAAVPADWVRLATFLREGSTALGAGNFGGTPLRTAVFYRRPTINTSGVIFFTTDNGAGGGAMTPTYGDEVIDRVTEIAITKNPFGGLDGLGNPVRDRTVSIDVRLTLRYFTHTQRLTNWCSRLDIQGGVAGCGAIVSAYRDLERSFNIVLRNNLVRIAGAAADSSAVDSEERVKGNLYFFRMVNPMRFQ